jgi:antitoxin component YwqK of YwqJK toxin-antitoxin module
MSENIEYNKIDSQGRRHGPWVFKHRLGEIAGETYYVNGVCQKYWKNYYPDGKLLRIIPYVNDHVEGEWIEYDYYEKQTKK